MRERPTPGDAPRPQTGRDTAKCAHAARFKPLVRNPWRAGAQSSADRRPARRRHRRGEPMARRMATAAAFGHETAARARYGPLTCHKSRGPVHDRPSPPPLPSWGQDHTDITPRPSAEDGATRLRTLTGLSVRPGAPKVTGGPRGDPRDSVEGKARSPPARSRISPADWARRMTVRDRTPAPRGLNVPGSGGTG